MRRVFVTGAGHGIGRAIVEAFVAEGDCVAFCDIDDVRGKEVAAATGARFFRLDVCDKYALEGAVKSLLDEWGDIDIVVNNVGIGNFAPITETTVEEFEMVVQVNGKVRATINILIDEDEESIKEKALACENVIKHTEGKEIVKVIVIKGKIVNIVVK